MNDAQAEQLARGQTNERGKARHSPVGQFLVAERDRAADWRRAFALSIREASADVECGAIGELNDQGAQPAFCVDRGQLSGR